MSQMYPSCYCFQNFRQPKHQSQSQLQVLDRSARSWVQVEGGSWRRESVCHLVEQTKRQLEGKKEARAQSRELGSGRKGIRLTRRQGQRSPGRRCERTRARSCCKVDRGVAKHGPLAETWKPTINRRLVPRELWQVSDRVHPNKKGDSPTPAE